jgi:hypothetical protein
MFACKTEEPTASLRQYHNEGLQNSALHQISLMKPRCRWRAAVAPCELKVDFSPDRRRHLESIAVMVMWCGQHETGTERGFMAGLPNTEMRIGKVYYLLSD